MTTPDYILPPKPGATCRACGYYKREQAPTDRQPVCCQCHGCACEECFTTTEHRHAHWEAHAPRWAVRVGREEDAGGYKYVLPYTNSAVINWEEKLSSDPTLARIFPTEKEAWAEAITWTHGHAHNLGGLQVEHDYLTILQVGMVEGMLCAMVNCPNYSHYQLLPQVVSYQGTKLGKTGWNSDTQHAHYQSNAPIVHVERW